jgi:hypothetical protein
MPDGESVAQHGALAGKGRGSQRKRQQGKPDLSRKNHVSS